MLRLVSSACGFVMRHLTDDIVLSVKDVVRNLRYAIRSEAASSTFRPSGDSEHGPASSRPLGREVRRRSRVARLVDKVFTEVETGTLALVSRERDAAHGLVFPRPVTDYFAGRDPRQDDDAERLFARTHYHAAKALLRGFGLSNMLISEHAIGRARDDVTRRHGDLVRRLRTSLAEPAAKPETHDRVLLCAAVTAALVAARPIKEVDFSHSSTEAPRGLTSSPNAYCFTVLGLAMAIVSVQDEAGAPQARDIVESANSVVDLRFQRFAEALEAERPAEALAREFGEVLPFLP
jgi:hypothetical protein